MQLVKSIMMKVNTKSGSCHFWTVNASQPLYWLVLVSLTQLEYHGGGKKASILEFSFSDWPKALSVWLWARGPGRYEVGDWTRARKQQHPATLCLRPYQDLLPQHHLDVKQKDIPSHFGSLLYSARQIEPGCCRIEKHKYKPLSQVILWGLLQSEV